LPIRSARFANAGIKITKLYKMKTLQEKIEKYEAKIAELKKEIEEQNPQSPKDFFLKMINGSTIKIDHYKFPNSTFYFDGDSLLLEIKKKEEKLYAFLNYEEIWNPISSQNNWNYSQTQEFFQLMIEDHFKLRDVTAYRTRRFHRYHIEDHFNNNN